MRPKVVSFRVPSTGQDSRAVDRGVVKFWKPEKGWGAISSPDLPDGKDAFAHFGSVEMDGYVELVAGQEVEFSYRPAQQDSFEYVAEWVRPLLTT